MAQAKKGTKKVFFPVETPLTSMRVSLLAYSPEELDGKFVKLDLTRSLRGKSLELRMRVRHENGKLAGEPVSLILAGSFIRRMFRKGIEYIEDSFVADCKDAKVIVKPFMMTRQKVSRAVRKQLRNVAKKYLESYIENRSSDELFSEIMSGKIRKDLSLKLKKIYPLALCEIRWFEVVGQRAVKKAEEAKEVGKEGIKEEGAKEEKAGENIAKIKETKEDIVEIKEVKERGEAEVKEEKGEQEIKEAKEKKVRKVKKEIKEDKRQEQ